MTSIEIFEKLLTENGKDWRHWSLGRATKDLAVEGGAQGGLYICRKGEATLYSKGSADRGYGFVVFSNNLQRPVALTGADFRKLDT